METRSQQLDIKAQLSITDTTEQFGIIVLVNLDAQTSVSAECLLRNQKSISQSIKALSHAIMQMTFRTKQEQLLTLLK